MASKFGFLVLASSVLAGCNNNNPAGGSGSPTPPTAAPGPASGSPGFAVATRADLPTCDASMFNHLGYVENTNQIFFCDATAWQEVKLPSAVAGATGPAGVAGPTGAAGPTGVAGPAGTSGATGAQGVAGVQGPAGNPAGVSLIQNVVSCSAAQNNCSPGFPSIPACTPQSYTYQYNEVWMTSGDVFITAAYNDNMTNGTLTATSYSSPGSTSPLTLSTPFPTTLYSMSQPHRFTSNGSWATGTYQLSLDSYASNFASPPVSSWTPAPIYTGVQCSGIAGGVVTSGAPVVTGTANTNNTAPTWTWSSGGNGNGQFRYSLNQGQFYYPGDQGTLTPPTPNWFSATTTAATSFTPTASTSPAAPLNSFSGWFLSVEEQDTLGNWGPAGEFTTNVDAEAPNAPNVHALAGISQSTTNLQPTWDWTPSFMMIGFPGQGDGTYRYELDASDFTGSDYGTTSATTYTPAAPLSAGNHALYVELNDIYGNWSSAGVYTFFLVDQAVPGAPAVSSSYDPMSLASTLTWNWSPAAPTSNSVSCMTDSDCSGTALFPICSQGQCAANTDTGNYRYSEDDPTFANPTATVATTFTDTAAANGLHTLYVEEQGTDGSWSQAGFYGVTYVGAGLTCPSNATGNFPMCVCNPGTGTYQSNNQCAN